MSTDVWSGEASAFPDEGHSTPYAGGGAFGVCEVNALENIKHIQGRRRVLREHFEGGHGSVDVLLESCVPSYCHPNVFAASVAWWRLFVASKFLQEMAPAGPVLDFGAGTGELGRLLPGDRPYDVVEHADELAVVAAARKFGARRLTLHELPAGHYAAICALDSLEHNDDIAPIIRCLRHALRQGGVLIVSGPTENWLYRLGRHVAGFSGHYHVANVDDVERAVAREFRLRRRVVGPLRLPLFALTVWSRTGVR